MESNAKTSHKMKTQYRAEIDGLRCLAVVPVMLFHAGISGFSGGYVGVDVFFVISGYLITGLILGEMAEGKFSIVDFYERRARRILPALFLVVVCCFPFAWFWMIPPELELFGQSVMAVLMFLSNFLFFQEAGYFGPSIDLLPLIHTWSLAVEEQFYLLFPLFLLAIYRFGQSSIFYSLLLIAILSLVLSGLVSPTAPDFAFYLLPARAWELFSGALVAMYMRDNQSARWQLASNNFLSVIGISLIGYAVLNFDETTIFPGWQALVPVVGTVLIILCAQPETWVGRILRSKPLVSIGLISYSAYLWHQPLFAFARIRSLGEPHEMLFIVLIFLSLVLAWLSWKFVEQPFRNREKTSRVLAFRSFYIAAFSLLGIGIALDSNNGYPRRLPESYLETLIHVFAVNPRESECNSGSVIVPLEERCIYGDEQNVTVAIWGDSHANALALGLGNTLGAVGRGLVEHSHNACPPVVGLIRPSRRDRCVEFNEEVEQSILEDEDIDVVVMSSRWTLYVEGDGFDNGEGGVERTSPVYGTSAEQANLTIDSAERKALVADLYLAQIRRLLDSGKRVVVVHPVPEAGWDVPNYLAREILFGIEREDFLSTSYDLYKERNRIVLEAFSSLPSSSNLIQMLPQELVCDSLMPGRCVLQDGRGPLYSDDDHLHLRINEVLSQYIVAELGY